MFENFIVIFFRFLPCSLETRISSRPRWQTYGFKNEKEEEETGAHACVDVDYEETVPELAEERSSAIRIPVTLGLYTRLETAITSVLFREAGTEQLRVRVEPYMKSRMLL